MTLSKLEKYTKYKNTHTTYILSDCSSTEVENSHKSKNTKEGYITVISRVINLIKHVIHFKALRWLE